MREVTLVSLNIHHLFHLSHVSHLFHLVIAHLDADAFFASAIVRKNPSLVGKPLLALGMGGGCVIAASYEAKAFGVKTGMRLVDAVKLCPNAVRMPADFHEAARASQQIEAILRETCPLIEQMSVDEWYLDLRTVTGGLPRNLKEWARDRQRTIAAHVGLTVSVGIGPSKLLAKMAGEYRKPAGVTVIGESIALEPFLKDRPAAAIPGIGRRRVIHTNAHGWNTAWDIAQAPAEELKRLFGKPGVELKEELLGHALYHVTAEEAPPKSVSRTRSFRPTKDRDYLWAHLLKHLEYVVLKMRRDDLMCRGISVWLRTAADDDYNHSGANASLSQPAHTADAILPIMRSCFGRLWRPGTAYTQAGLALWRLVPAGAPQYSLFKAPEVTERDEAIQTSLDELHERFGRNAITRGSALAVKTGTAVTVDLSVY